MLRLAMTTDAETFERVADPLAERGIEVGYVPTDERTFALGGEESTDLGEFDVGLVYPSRLAEGGVVDALLDVPWVNDREAMLRSRHKGEALARLSRAGVPVPESVVVSNPVDDDHLRDTFERFDRPVVVKPNSTTRGTGITKVHDADSFLGVTDYLSLVHDYRATGDKSFLVQEFLPEARDYRAMVVDGDCVGGVERRLSEDARAAGQWKHNVHRGAVAEGVSLPRELRTVAEDAAAALGVDYLGVDLLVTDDRVVVGETNARPTVDDETKYDPGFYDDFAALIRSQVE
ncbi:ATP-grasp domain-containing protein [Halomarina oriensis]|uniref:ATP-grasp domain-containing protein n=1 Tax=Halomarina oriensis TaxID=671145 RepID=A0A6B0GJ91_9EURY|nr:RimK family alpha-L-glutamate ligase [Halomarina oriensis]MWG34976.1 ATP-grasp domain-containing protein [Halomarina oriensis]